MKTAPLPALLGGLVLGVAGSVGWRVTRNAAIRQQKAPESALRGGKDARRLHGAAALLAASVLADSALEHYRGSFENPGMFAPLISSTLALGAGTGGVRDGTSRASREQAFRLAVGVGAVGLSFHLYNIFKRPGGLSWLNLFYGAPVGAPAALSLCGLLGLSAQQLARENQTAPRLLGLPAGRMLAALTSFSLLGTVVEVALLHFRGAFQNPAMYTPITLPPVGAGLLAKAAIERPSKAHLLTRFWLWLCAALGVVGVGFHAFGVSRAMGGWRNWSQNLIDGPPLPAPPSFSALSLAGLVALSLIEREADEGDRRAP